MTDLIVPPFEPNFECMISDLTRFEALYAEKRWVESEIEKTISEVDQEATDELESAEAELQETKLKSAILVARLESAAGGTLLSIV